MRTEQQIFDALVELCKSPGYAHAIAYLCLRDNTVAFRDEMTAADMQHMFTDERLSRTEIATLIGLLVRVPVDYAKPEFDALQRYADSTDALLAELHQSMSREGMATHDWVELAEKGGNPFANGAAMREPIFYGGESAYSFQYRDLSVRKYGADSTWLKANRGFTPDVARNIGCALERLQNAKIVHCRNEAQHANSPEAWTFLSIYQFSVEELVNESGHKREDVEAVLAAFSLPADNRNESFQSLHDFNVTNACPILRVGDGTFILFQAYSLMEALYESPFYWMTADVSGGVKASLDGGAKLSR
ncbi:prepilin peptidase, partial [Paraburkholderia madseniana]|nr:prepilin peptidase [Paraburkholderia madseniana]MDQ6465346.1 prepilin peptidase [Paraburkholderia madseniana]